jgi:hypothetical protein
MAISYDAQFEYFSKLGLKHFSKAAALSLFLQRRAIAHRPMGGGGGVNPQQGKGLFSQESRDRINNKNSLLRIVRFSLIVTGYIPLPRRDKQ